MLEKLKLFFNHQRYQSATFLICCLLVIFVISCQPKVTSLSNPSVKVDRLGLDSEVEAYLRLAESRYEKLGQQEKLQDLISSNATLLAENQPLNPVGILTSLFAIFGIGATVDNVRRRKTESKLKSIIAKSESS